MEIKNLTPHPIVLIREEGEKVLQPEGVNPRVLQNKVLVGEVAGLPLYKTVLGEVEGLPQEEEGVILIVSGMVAQAVPERKDLVVPGDFVRDDQGRIIGCKSLLSYAK